MKVLITGAGGFIGKNLQQHLAERKDVEVVCFTHTNTVAQLPRLLQGVEFVFHLAGVNRSQVTQEFVVGNIDLTVALAQAMEAEMRSRVSNLLSFLCYQEGQATIRGPFLICSVYSHLIYFANAFNFSFSYFSSFN